MAFTNLDYFIESQFPTLLEDSDFVKNAKVYGLFILLIFKNFKLTKGEIFEENTSK
ncbi:MAG: hypothetical protein ACFFG0_25435 [Candidatus Thorarchaeota archaeon]